jgi:hypothetical protein
MENLVKVSESFLIIDRYSDYLYRKAWGKVLIIWGIILPLTIVIFNFSTQLSMITSIDTIFLKFFATSLSVLLGTGLTLYIFISVPKMTLTKKKEDEDSSVISHHHGLILGITWFLLFQVPNFILEPFNTVSYVLVSSIALIISFILLKRVHGTYKELLITGIILLISTIPLVLLLLINLVVLAQIATAIVFAISFLSGGLYSMQIAANILDGNV